MVLVHLVGVSPSLCVASLNWLVGQGRSDVVTPRIYLV